MNKEKLISLTKYQSDLKSKLSDPIPSKHKHRPAEYKNFLKNEIRIVSDKIDAAKLESAPVGK